MIVKYTKLGMLSSKVSVAGVNVTLSWPSSSVDNGIHDASLISLTPPSSPLKGVVFLLPGAMISISEYNNIRNVILEQNQLVVSLYMNVLWPIRNNHRKHAKNVKKVFDGLKSIYKEELSKINMYTIIGHSVGGKVGLLVASIMKVKLFILYYVIGGDGTHILFMMADFPLQTILNRESVLNVI